MEFILIFGVIWGVVAAAIANTKGRSVVGWFFAGFFIGLIGVIIIACLSNKKEEQQYRDHVAQENRRLREKLDQERLKSEALRQHVTGRLDLHDAQLGTDTRAFRAALPGMTEGQAKFPLPDELDSLFMDESPQPAGLDFNVLPATVANDSPPVQQVAPIQAQAQAQAPAAQNSKPQPGTRQWFFEQNGKSHGPVLEPELMGMFDDGRLNGATLVWTESLSDWVAAKRVKLLKPHIKS
jgi:uncharacterized membrane protein YeaQ/YmgE (transglycosylase-associated protein family)